MKINGKEFEFDIADVECIEKYEAALKKVKDTAKNAPKDLTGSAAMRAACESIYTFFDDVLGEGKAIQVFDGKMNVRVCWDAFEKFVDECSNECQAIGTRFSKYSANRAQRRS